MSQITNPILPGFNPDPSIIRVGDDYYIATSTFEWFPGVQIHHSRDLIHWKLIGHPLSRKSQLDIKGNVDSGGVWAPCLSYDNGTYYLIFTDVKSHFGGFKDTHNYLVTATDIKGPWSEPIYLNSSGFDPSLFHDDDGQKWFVNMVWDHRKGKNRFGGILLQEYSEAEKKLVGPIKNIFKGSELGLTEAPHIYKINGWYYLMTAEGGTRVNHAVTMARSRSIEGPYEVDPENPMLTSANKAHLTLQKAGHGSLVETQNGEWYLAHLCSRFLYPSERSILGRETAIQKCEWSEEGWLRVVGGKHGDAQVKVQAPNLPEHPFVKESPLDDFENKELNIHFNSLRVPIEDSWASLTERPGFLRLYGRESLNSLHRQSLIARRQQAFNINVETVVEFEPDSFQQLAGLIYYYNTKNYYYLHVSHDEDLGKCIGILSNTKGIYDEPSEGRLSIDSWDRCYLKAEIREADLQFYYSSNGTDWIKLGPILDATTISDEHADQFVNGYILDQGFTGAFIGMCVQDLTGRNLHGDFDYFKYEEIE
ncbi:MULTISPECIES: glycoside hydrolase family 43 protein [Bacillaceae]|uniref:Glycoside hydrolase family 43 protein n=1 Tax=Evansella alkalicola TaxID=745819 RepID=A0ABS6JWR0_9BACI|nr:MULTISPECIES: glycoside hydrolase family 43 protein [Bacillaceae]MBU9721560.1 glycoside hydrolase family 43 protein [Bacillus alkalicola]